jgi:hypothetical protein
MIDLTSKGLESMNKAKEGIMTRSMNSEIAFWR